MKGCRDLNYTLTTQLSAPARPCPAVLRAGSSSLPHFLISFLREKRYNTRQENVYPGGCRNFGSNGHGSDAWGKCLVEVRTLWNYVLMRNTSKSESLIRARDERTVDHALASGPGGVPPGAGERNRGTAMRSARAELATRARAVENMNEVVHSQDWPDEE